LLEPVLVTYNKALSWLTAAAKGPAPTDTVATTVRLAISIIEILSEPELTT
jgi:hypothetical protein